MPLLKAQLQEASGQRCGPTHRRSHRRQRDPAMWPCSRRRAHQGPVLCSQPALPRGLGSGRHSSPRSPRRWQLAEPSSRRCAWPGGQRASLRSSPLCQQQRDCRRTQLRHQDQGAAAAGTAFTAGTPSCPVADSSAVADGGSERCAPPPGRWQHTCRRWWGTRCHHRCGGRAADTRRGSPASRHITAC